MTTSTELLADWLNKIDAPTGDQQFRLSAAAAELRRLSAELEECQAQRRAAFRRIEEQDKELAALKAAMGEPVAYMTEDGRVSAKDTVENAMPKAVRSSFTIPLYAIPKDKP